MKNEKVSFDELKQLFEEYDSNIPKIGRFYMQAKEAWKDAKPMLIELRKDPGARVNPHPDLNWFLKYRNTAREIRKKNEVIHKKIMKVLNEYNKSVAKSKKKVSTNTKTK